MNHKRLARQYRSLYHRAREYIRSFGLGELYFYERYDGLVFSLRSDLGTEVRDKDKIKSIIYGEMEIRNWDTGKVYDNFSEYRKELLIIKMVGLNEDKRSTKNNRRRRKE